MQIQLEVNKRPLTVEVENDEPLLWALRDGCKLKSPKYGCGAARCGACTVLVDGIAKRSCVMPARDAVGRAISTVEGLAENGVMHPVQRAWVEENVPQCGYCQCGQIMGAVALLSKVPEPSIEEIEVAMSGHLCRCGTYPRIVKAIQRASRLLRGEK